MVSAPHPGIQMEKGIKVGGDVEMNVFQQMSLVKENVQKTISGLDLKVISVFLQTK